MAAARFSLASLVSACLPKETFFDVDPVARLRRLERCPQRGRRAKEESVPACLTHSLANSEALKRDTSFRRSTRLLLLLSLLKPVASRRMARWAMKIPGDEESVLPEESLSGTTHSRAFCSMRALAHLARVLPALKELLPRKG